MAGRPKADSGIKSKKDIVSAMHKDKVFDVETLVVAGARNNEAFEKLQKLFPVHDAGKRKISDAEIKIAYTHETGKPFPVRAKKTGKRSVGKNPPPREMSIADKLAEIKRLQAELDTAKNEIENFKEGKEKGVSVLANRIVSLKLLMNKLGLSNFESLVDVVGSYGGNVLTPDEAKALEAAKALEGEDNA